LANRAVSDVTRTLYQCFKLLKMYELFKCQMAKMGGGRSREWTDKSKQNRNKSKQMEIEKKKTLKSPAYF